MKVCVVGAGANGLVCAKELLDQGFEVRVLEQRSGLGGLWRFNSNEKEFSPCYESLTTNTPKRLTAFQGYPMPDEFPTYPHHIQMLHYLENFAKTFKLIPHIIFSTKVEQIRHHDNGWMVTRTDIYNNTTSTYYDAIAVCSGHHWKKREMKWKGREFFQGPTIHSGEYRTPKRWENKKIIIAGMGVSGREIMTDILSTGKTQLLLSSSRQETELELSEEILTKVSVHKLIKAITGPKSVEFLDGTVANDIDGIIYCSGYLIHIPYLNIKELGIFEEEKQILNLYQRICVPGQDTLGFISFVTTYGSMYPIAEVQSRFFALTLAGKILRPSEDAMNQEIALWRSSINESYRPMNVDYWNYIGHITKLLPKQYRVAKTIPPPTLTQTVKVASIQAPSILGDTKSNIKRFTRLIIEAASNGAKFIVIPEAAIPGYVSQDLKECWHIPGRPLAVSPIENQDDNIANTHQKFVARENLESVAESIPGPSTILFAGLAEKLGCYLVIPLIEKVARIPSANAADASFFVPYPWTFYNSCVLLSPDGKLVGHYRKNNLWGCVDNAWCTAGTESCVVQTEYGRVGLAICFDVHIMYERYKHEGIWCLLYPIAWVDRDIETWFTIDLPERIANSGFHVVGSNWSVENEEEGALWKGYGHSKIYRNDGTVMAAANTLYGDEIIYAELPYESQTTSDHSSDLLSLNEEPLWTRRSKTTGERFNERFTFTMNRLDGPVSISLAQGGDAEHLGMTVWDGGIVLAKYFERLEDEKEVTLSGKSSLELGSGTGVLGIALACLGAHVLLTDMEESELISQLQRNVDTNVSILIGEAKVMTLDWNYPELFLDKLPKQMDFIVAADVIYDISIVKPLVQTLEILCKEDTVVFLSYEMHHLVPVTEFFRLIRRSFYIQHIPCSDLHAQYQCGGIQVKRLQKFASNKETNFASSPMEQLIQLQQKRDFLMKEIGQIDVQMKKLLLQMQLDPVTSAPVGSSVVSENSPVTGFQKRIKTRPNVDSLIKRNIAFLCKCDTPCPLLCQTATKVD